MNSTEPRLASASDLDWILETLRKDGPDHAPVIQDLLRWPDSSRFHFLRAGNRLAFAHRSGHPAYDRAPCWILDGDPSSISRLLDHVKPGAPFVVRETSDRLASAIRDYYPETKVYLEQRMDVSRETFRPAHRGRARQLRPADLEALTRFHGAPAQAASRFMGWLNGARAFHGVFEGDQLVAIGSSFVSIPEAWNLVSIATHPDHRGKGLATEVTSSLVGRALEETRTVTVTVVCGNAPAIRVYEKLGFEATHGYLWADCGAGSAP